MMPSVRNPSRKLCLYPPLQSRSRLARQLLTLLNLGALEWLDLRENGFIASAAVVLLYSAEPPSGRPTPAVFPQHPSRPCPGRMEIEKHFLCPITQRLMRHPVCTVTGHTYEQDAIEDLLRSRNTDPVTGASAISHYKFQIQDQVFPAGFSIFIIQTTKENER